MSENGKRYAALEQERRAAAEREDLRCKTLQKELQVPPNPDGQRGVMASHVLQAKEALSATIPLCRFTQTCVNLFLRVWIMCLAGVAAAL